MKTIIQTHNDETFIYFAETELALRGELVSLNESDFNPSLLQNIGYIQFYVNPSESEVNVSYVYIAEKFRGQRLGEQLLGEMIRYSSNIMKKQSVKQYEIKLDDMSDRFGRSNNLYLKMGFIYCSEDEDGPCGPEMSINIST